MTNPKGHDSPKITMSPVKNSKAVHQGSPDQSGSSFRRNLAGPKRNEHAVRGQILQTLELGRASPVLIQHSCSFGVWTTAHVNTSVAATTI